MAEFVMWEQLEEYSPPAHVGTTNRRILDGATSQETLSMVRGRLQPGGCAEAHYHRVSTQVTHVIAGRCRVEVDGQVQELGPGDTVFIPVGQVHVVTVLGETDLQLVNVYHPPLQTSDILTP